MSFDAASDRDDESNPRDAFRDDLFQPEPPPRRPLSTGTKVLLTLGVAFGVLMLLCCGVAGWFGYQVHRGVSPDPQEIARIRGEIVREIKLPEEFKPRLGMDLPFFGVKASLYIADRQAGGGEMLMLMSVPPGLDPREIQFQVEQAMGQDRQHFDMQPPETKRVRIEGEDVEFQFARGKDRQTGAEVRQVLGVLAGPEGTIMVLMVVGEEDWDESRVLEILESIKK
jgi:hypothetical protein